MLLTILVLMFYVWMLKMMFSIIGWGIRFWFLILIGIFTLMTNLVYYLIPVIVVMMIIRLLKGDIQ